jgi:hypothetical protein
MKRIPKKVALLAGAASLVFVGAAAVTQQATADIVESKIVVLRAGDYIVHAYSGQDFESVSPYQQRSWQLTSDNDVQFWVAGADPGILISVETDVRHGDIFVFRGDVQRPIVNRTRIVDEPHIPWDAE